MWIIIIRWVVGWSNCNDILPPSWAFSFVTIFLNFFVTIIVNVDLEGTMYSLKTKICVMYN